MSRREEISPFHLDILKEIGNIGAGNAATALSVLIGKKVDMEVPSVKVISLNEITEVLGGADNVVAAIFFRVEGDVPASFFFIQHIDEAIKLVNDITNEKNEDLQSLSELSISALQEIGNILTGSYLSALSDFTNITMVPTVPALAIDMAGAVLIQGIVSDCNVGDDAVLIDTSFVEIDDKLSNLIKGYFFLLPDQESFKTIFAALGVPFDDRNY
jgi:chemotaxis protein CheC